MNPIFERLYDLAVKANLSELTKEWDEHGVEWLDEISGGIVNYTGLKMSVYKPFDELDGETQYAFACWIEKQKIKPNEEA